MTLNLLLLGRGGNGKSSTGNSILGDKIFMPKSLSTNVKIDITKAYNAVDGKKVVITEVAGLEYLNSDNSEHVEDTFTQIEDAVRVEQDGYNAVPIVLKYGVRFTKQEQELVMLIKSTFGSSVIKNYGIIVMTCGDSFELDMEEDGLSFQEWCKAQTGDIQELFAECNGRCVLFNNREKDKKTLEEQRAKLFSFVKDIQSKITPYKVNEFAGAVDSRKKILVASKLKKLEAETRAIMNNIGESLDKLSAEVLAASDNKATLEYLLAKLVNQKKHLQKEDMETLVLNQLLIEMSVTEMRIMTKIKLAEQRIHACESDWVFVSQEGMEYSYEQFTVMMDTRALLADKLRNGIYDSENSGQDKDDILREGNSTILVEIRKATLKNDDKQVTDDLEEVQFIFTKIDTVLSPHKFKNTVFIFLKYGIQFTEKEICDVILKIQSYFGSSKDKNKSILVLTYKDIKDLQAELDPNFEQWCKKQTGVYQALLNECKGRCLLFNTGTDSQKTPEYDESQDNICIEYKYVKTEGDVESSFLKMVYRIAVDNVAKCLHYLGKSCWFDNVSGKITDMNLQTTTSGQKSIHDDSNSNNAHVDDINDDKQGKKDALEKDETENVISGAKGMNNYNDNHF